MEPSGDNTTSQSKTSWGQAFANVLLWGKQNTVWVLLLLGLIQGLLYTFTVPPWWNHDEPGHFEFAWQIANFAHWPGLEEYDPEMRLAVARSMDSYNRYLDFATQPDLSGNQPVYIGVSQHSDAPLYHWAASLLLRLMPQADLVTQLLSLRLFSVALFLLSLWAAWMALGEILPAGHALRTMSVAFMALLPGMALTMSAVNDDAGGVLTFTLFLWASLALMQRGFSPVRILALLASMALCYWTKNTTWPALLLGPVALVLTVFRQRRVWLPWLAGATLSIALLVVSFRNGDAALWYRQSDQAQTTRAQSALAIDGGYVLHLYFERQDESHLAQIINTPAVRPLRGQPVTLAGWVWADHKTQIRLPDLFIDLDKNLATRTESRYLPLGTTPVFFHYTVSIPDDAKRLLVRIWPRPNFESYPVPVHIYLDGLLLVPGERQGEPEFYDFERGTGIWNGQAFQNLIRNPSAETDWIQLRPEAKSLIQKIFPFGSAYTLAASFQDAESAWPYYRSAFLQVFQTFWGRGPSARVEMMGGKQIYPILQTISALSVLGGIALTIRKRTAQRWNILLFLALAASLVWGIAILRGASELLSFIQITPWARYGMPAILPIALLLCAGWLRLLDWLGLKNPALFLSAFLIALNYFSLLGIVQFFNPGEHGEYVVFLTGLALAVYFSLRGVLGRLKANHQTRL